MPLSWSKDLREIVFRLTPNRSLNSQRIGDKIIHSIKIKLSRGLSLRFENHYKRYENDDNETVSFSELVAVCKLSPKLNLDATSIFTDHIQDILLLASLAERHRCSCVGWSSLDRNILADFYRGDISIPDEKKEKYNELIDIANVEEYLQKTYFNLHNIEFKENVRRAIILILPNRETVESEFLSLFTALETLVLGFRRWRNREFIFSDDDEWKNFETSFQRWVKKDSILSGDKNKRKLIYEVSGGLQRVSFARAFKEMCKHYPIDLTDLWSVTERENKEWSLTDIRNKLVHGESLNQPRIFSLWTANANLRWTVERLILSVLGWEISKSKVSPRTMSHLTAYKIWRTDRTKISGS